MLVSVLLGLCSLAAVGGLGYWLWHTPKAKAEAQVGALKDAQATVQSDAQKVESGINSVEKKL